MSRTVQKWGNSLGIRIPKDLADQVELRDGSEVEFHVRDGSLVIEPVKNRYELDELVANITEENRHDDQKAGSVGQESW